MQPQVEFLCQVEQCCFLITTCWCNDGLITWRPGATDLFFFPFLSFPFPSWLTKNRAALQVEWAYWETECSRTNYSFFHFLQMSLDIWCLMHRLCSNRSFSHFKRVFFSVTYACKCYSLSWFSSSNLKTRLMDYSRNTENFALFVISSPVSLLPLHKKKESVQSTLFFKSNARQMWLTCRDSYCSPCASTAFCLTSCIFLMHFDIC